MITDQKRCQKAIVGSAGLTAPDYRRKMGRPTPW